MSHTDFLIRHTTYGRNGIPQIRGKKLKSYHKKRICTERQDASSNVVLVLQHPLMPLEISSSEMSVQNAHAALFGMHSGQVQGPVSIQLFCSAISGIEPIAHVHSAFNPTHNTANISVGINLCVMLDMSVYVTQVLDHLSGLADED